MLPDPSPAYNILVVDDETPVRHLIRRMLQQAGHRVTDFERPIDALSLVCSDEGARLDAAVIDLLMPGMTGEILGENIRRRFPTMPIVFVSGYSADKHRGWLSGDARSVFLAKPFTSAQLREGLRRVMVTTE